MMRQACFSLSLVSSAARGHRRGPGKQLIADTRHAIGFLRSALPALTRRACPRSEFRLSQWSVLSVPPTDGCPGKPPTTSRTAQAPRPKIRQGDSRARPSAWAAGRQYPQINRTSGRSSRQQTIAALPWSSKSLLQSSRPETSRKSGLREPFGRPARSGANAKPKKHVACRGDGSSLAGANDGWRKCRSSNKGSPSQ